MNLKKKLTSSLLIQELIEIRLDTLWRMLFLLERRQLPGVAEEGATGKLDNKGAIFVPGGLIHQDVDDKKISHEPWNTLSEKIFRKQVRKSMQFDNATLLFPDGIANSVNLDSGFFARAARRIYTFKTAAFKRKKKIGRKVPVGIDSNDIVRSHCPPYLKPPYGSRTRISTCVSIALTDPHMYFAYCKAEFCLSEQGLENFAKKMDMAQDGMKLPDGTPLYPPYVVVCHDTRYSENNLTGLIRILGIGKFGEFSTLTFEMLNNKLRGEIKRKKVHLNNDFIFAEHAGVEVVGVLRTFSATNPGKRSTNYHFDLLSPQKDLTIDLDRIMVRAMERYHSSGSSSRK